MSSPTVAIVGYGMGNVTSLRNALEAVEANVAVAMAPEDLDGASHVILPGVGAFPKGMAQLHAGGFADALHDVARSGRPLLGICLGMQLLATVGEEHVVTDGLGLVAGRVARIDRDGLRVPHMGWNDTVAARDSVLLGESGKVDCYYFVHSYELRPDDPADISLVTEYGGDVVAGVERDNVLGVQFHPEKSHEAGLALLRRFVAL